MPVYLPTPNDIGDKLFCIVEVSNFEKGEYAYLTVVLETGKQTVIFYKYPPDYVQFMSKIVGYVPVHRVRFAKDGTLNFQAGECSCGYSENRAFVV